MEITRTRIGDVMHVQLTGRLDGYWSDHLNGALSDVLRDGHHHVRVDCANVTYLTSAGIGVLMRYYKELVRINGTFEVVNPSTPVTAVLKVARLANYLIAPAREAAPAAAPDRVARRIEHPDIAVDVFDVNPGSTLRCRAIGDASALATGDVDERRCATFANMAPAIAVGIGAFGASLADCRGRFGELISVSGATAYQPGDGTNVADYLLAAGDLGGDIHVLYCLECEGRFAQLIRFEASQPAAAVPLSRLLSACFDAAASDSLAVVLIAEAAGIVGASLRQSPAEQLEAGGFFAHPAVRARLSFTTERAFVRSVVLAAGVATRDPLATGRGRGQLRPLGAGYVGHFHAAAFRFRPIRKGPIDLAETVAGLFEPEQLLGVIHLLNDDRPIAGRGESEFVRGACWIGPIAGDWPVA